MSLFIDKNIFFSLFFIVCPMVGMDQSHESAQSVTTESSLAHFKTEYLDDILANSLDAAGNIVTFEDRYDTFVHEFSQLDLGDFRAFFKKQITKKQNDAKARIIVTPEQIDIIIARAEKKIVSTYLKNKEYQDHIHQVILDGIQDNKKVEEIEDPLLMHLTTISFLQSVMTQYINAYKEDLYDLDSQDEQDSEYEDRVEYNNSVESRDPLFFEALRHKNDSFIDFFIDCEVNLDFVGENNNNLLHCAAQYDNTKLALFLIEKGLTRWNEINDYTEYPLHVAAQYNSDNVAVLLLNAGVDVDQTYDNSVLGNSPLCWAIRYDADKVGKTLLDRSAHVQDYFLDLAAQYDAHKIIPHLVIARFQQTPHAIIHALSKAAERDNVQAAQALLDFITIEYVPVFLQVDDAQGYRLRFEVKDQSMIFHRKDILYADPIFCAVKNNSQKIMKLFLEHDKINKQNLLQQSNILEVAVSHDADKIVKLLIAQGMNLNVVGYQNLNLLQRAAKNTAYKSIPLLLEAGLTIDNQMLLSCLQPYISKLSGEEQSCATSLIKATNSSYKKRKNY